MLLRFTKMHEFGNDFVVLDLLTQRFQVKPSHIRKLADRRLGVGCDHVLVAEPPTRADADFRCRLFNADGSEEGPLGNGMRSLARFAHDKQLTGSSHLTLEAQDQLFQAELLRDHQVRICLGTPTQQAATPAPVTVLDQSWPFQLITIASIPHAVFAVDDLETLPEAALKEALNRHASLLHQARLVFMQRLDSQHARVRAYTPKMDAAILSGSDMCTAVVAGCMQGELAPSVEVQLAGGMVNIDWQGQGHPVSMTGPATTVFEGQFRF